MLKTFRLIAFAFAACVAAAEPSFAQMAQPTLRQGRPSRGLFGGGVGDTQQNLSATFMLGGGRDWDRSAPPVLPAGSPPPPEPFYTGTYGSASATLTYSLSKERIHAGASVGGTTRYNQNSATRISSFGSGAQVSAQLTTRMSISATQGVSYQPHNIQNLFGSWVDPGSNPLGLMDLSGATVPKSVFQTQSAAGFTYSLARRVGFTANYDYQVFNAFDGDPATGSRSQTAGAGLAFNIARGVSFRVGYSQSTSRFGTNAPVSYGGATMDGGLSFDRALSVTRRSTVSFGTGLAGVRDINGSLRYLLTGRVNFNYEIGRSWTAAVNYRRGVDFSQGFALPVVLSTASVGVGGGIGRRFQLQSSGGASQGNLGVGAASPDFTVLTGTVSLRAAITRNLGASLNYGYRHYQFDDPASLPIGMRPESDRHNVSASLDIWVPLFTRARRADAAR